jgi:phage terminase small subunit
MPEPYITIREPKGKPNMPRGGYRPGGGRPLGSKDRVPRAKIIPPDSIDPTPDSIEPDAEPPRGKDPLSYMLSVMNDPSATQYRRDRMAIAAAPFIHRRADDLGKKRLIEEEARTAHIGTSWEKLLAGRYDRVAVSGPARDGAYRYPGTVDDDE